MGKTISFSPPHFRIFSHGMFALLKVNNCAHSHFFK